MAMSQRSSEARLAWGVWGLTTASLAGWLVLTVLNPSVPVPVEVDGP